MVYGRLYVAAQTTAFLCYQKNPRGFCTDLFRSKGTLGTRFVVRLFDMVASLIVNVYLVVNVVVHAVVNVVVNVVVHAVENVVVNVGVHVVVIVRTNNAM